MRKPRRLQPGDRIAVVAPASPFDAAAFERGLGELRRLGYEPFHSETIFERRGYFAGEARERAADLEGAFEDPSSGAVLSARGGYGSVHVLPFLRRDVAAGWRAGFVAHSDLTAILTWLTCHLGLVCFHGPHVAGGLARGKEGYDPDTFVRALSRAEPMGELSAPGLEALHAGEAEGLLVGGNLTMLASSLGTPFAFDPPQGSVIFLDEIGERPYRLDRLLTQMRLSGALARASAIVFNELPGCEEPGGTLQARDVVADTLADFPGPVLFGLPSGHARLPAMTLPMGVRVRVVAGSSPRLIVEEAAVE